MATAGTQALGWKAMRRRVRRAGGLTLLALALAGLAPTLAGAYVLAGARWPSRVIPYYDAGPDHAAVRAAVQAWNTSGANLRFVAVPRNRAHLLIVPMHPAGCYGIVGFGTLGYGPRGDRVQLRPCANQAEDVITAAHELGHVLGLNHEWHHCATMNASAGYLCGNPPLYQQLCRVLQPDDVRGAVARYGGVVRPIRSPQFCPEFSAPSAPDSAHITGQTSLDGQLSAQVHVAPERRLIVVPGQGAPYLEVSVYRYADACPSAPPDGQPLDQQPVGNDGNVRLYLGDRAETSPGQWCYLFRTSDGAGRHSGRLMTTTVQIPHIAPVAAFDPPADAYAGNDLWFSDASQQGDDPIVKWAWNFGDGSTSTDQYADHVYDQTGSYTVTLTVTASDGQAATISHQVTIADAPAYG